MRFENKKNIIFHALHAYFQWTRGICMSKFNHLTFISWATDWKWRANNHKFVFHSFEPTTKKKNGSTEIWPNRKCRTIYALQASYLSHMSPSPSPSPFTNVFLLFVSLFSLNFMIHETDLKEFFSAFQIYTKTKKNYCTL